MPNTFPIHIERRFELLYNNYVERLALGVVPDITREYKKEIALSVDTLDDELVKLELQASKFDPATTGELVSLQGFVIPRFMRDQLQVVMADLNKWSFERMRDGANRLAKKTGIKDLGVRVLEESGRIEVQVTKASVRNAELIKNIKTEYFNRIAKSTRDAVNQGLSNKELARKLLRVKGATQAKAKFWARDQTSKLMGDLNRIRQTDAGFPGYIWETSQDARVRESHAWRHGLYFKWGETDIDPGDDFNDRCSAEPAFGPGDQQSLTMRRKSFSRMNRDRRRINKLKGSKIPLLSPAALEEMGAEQAAA